MCIETHCREAEMDKYPVQQTLLHAIATNLPVLVVCSGDILLLLG